MDDINLIEGEKYLIIAGCSGTGKNELMKKLINQYPEIFFKINQATTRDIRDDEAGDTYMWLDSVRDYKKIEHLLIGRTEINGNYYGSIPVVDDEKIGIIILNEMGLKDFVSSFQNDTGVKYFILGLDKDYNDLPVKREGRDKDFIEKEKAVLNFCDEVISLEKDVYANPKEVINFIKDYLRA